VGIITPAGSYVATTEGELLALLVALATLDALRRAAV
jgi:hypothetical protein